MTIHRIRLLGDPILRTRCEPITKPGSTAVRVILDDLRETLRDWQSRFGSGRGIAAPGPVAEIRVKPGDTVKVGQVLMTFEVAGAPAVAPPDARPVRPDGRPRRGAFDFLHWRP